MNVLVEEFKKIHGNQTRQIGDYFCIPAVVSNAARILGGTDFSQERIRDVWYQYERKVPEPFVKDQMRGAGPGVITALKARTDFDQRFNTDPFERARDRSAFNAAKAEDAIAFVSRHLKKDHPVMVSTDHVAVAPEMVHRQCCHMWLVLSLDEGSNIAVVHDPGGDKLFRIDVRKPLQANHLGTVVEMDRGLRGRFTHSNYYCLALQKIET